MNLRDGDNVKLTYFTYNYKTLTNRKTYFWVRPFKFLLRDQKLFKGLYFGNRVILPQSN